VPIIRRTNSICATLVLFTLYGWLSGLLLCFGQLCAHHQVNLTVSMRYWYFSLCVGVYLVFCTCFEQLCAHHQENSLYLCDTGTVHSVWVSIWSSVHVSSNYVPIIRRTHCIYATLVLFTLYGLLVGMRLFCFIFPFSFSLVYLAAVLE